MQVTPQNWLTPRWRIVWTVKLALVGVASVYFFVLRKEYLNDFFNIKDESDTFKTVMLQYATYPLFLFVGVNAALLFTTPLDGRERLYTLCLFWKICMCLDVSHIVIATYFQWPNFSPQYPVLISLTLLWFVVEGVFIRDSNKRLFGKSDKQS
jgi:hypothetical protein